jgi:DmsE family decaheme c-type cytochrome
MRTLNIVKIVLVAIFCMGAVIVFVPTGMGPVNMASSDKKPKVDKEPKQRKADPKSNQDDYVGSESCATCHNNESAHFSITAHRKTMNDQSFPFDQRGCEACHGGAKKHVEFHKAAAQLYEEGKPEEAESLYADKEKAESAKVRYFKTLPAAEASAVCLKCHEGEQGRSEERFNFRRSDHHKAGVSCLDCHASHSPKRAEFLLRDTQPSLCYSCHAEQKASFSRPFHHKVPEGTMKCSDCHNQHGGFQAKQLRTGVGADTACLKCHSDKVGPFVFEHAPVKLEGCVSCHTPHGSNNPRMLNRNSVKSLCLECHSNTPTLPGQESTGSGPTTPSFHNLATPRFQNCTVCHVMIHGSNTNKVFFR